MVSRIIFSTLTTLLLLAGCSEGDSLQQIQSAGSLKVVTRNSPTTYFIDKHGATGFEHALVGLLAQELGVELDMRPAFSLADIFVQLSRSDVDLAAAGLTLTGEREAQYPHSSAYYRLVPQVVYRAGNYRPRKLQDLKGMDILVLADSSHSQALNALKSGGYPDLAWREIVGGDTSELLELVSDGGADLALIDSNEFTVQQSLYPRLKVAFDLGTEQDLVWYLPPGTDNARLLEKMNALFSRLQENGTLERMREEHFGHTAGVTRVGSHTFTRKMQRSLPQYRTLIEKVAAEYQMDWHLLAAIAYQESHWNPVATSPTGVRGMMMLTQPTAREMGVTNRLDPRQSLSGGARYLKNIKRRLPADIYDPDRTWLALAAYNIGRGHMEDARVLTERHGGDPHLWQDVVERLPLLQKSQYFQTVKHGYARGQEAATYVQNIRHYYSILQWQDIQQNKPVPPIEMESFLPEKLLPLSLHAL